MVFACALCSALVRHFITGQDTRIVGDLLHYDLEVFVKMFGQTICLCTLETLRVSSGINDT